MTKELYLIPQKEIENRILTLRSVQVMIDKDLAEMYDVETKVLNQAVKRNIERFPELFRFQLTEAEKNELVTNCDRFKNLKHATTFPYAFTEQGVAMLSAVLRSDTAVRVSIQIITAFVEMRKLLQTNETLFHRLDKMELKQIESDQKFEKIFKALESKDKQPNTGIFFDGQVFDAWVFIAGLVRKARKSIILVDNYVDETVLTLFAKRKKGVQLTIFTKEINKELELDIKKHNAQYDAVRVKILKQAHGRFLIIDDTGLYHIGASLKDLGKKWFAFSKMDGETMNLLEKLKGNK